MTETISNLIYLDTNVFIKAVEGLDEEAVPARKLISALRERQAGVAATSEITFAELLVPSKRAGSLPLETKRRAYLDLLLWSGLFTLVPVSRQILIETASLRAVRTIKLPDAVHLVSAIQLQCRYFVSADRDFDALPAGMERVSSDEKGLALLLGELS